MPRLTSQNPKYAKHRASGQAVVTLDGRDFYLGPHGTKASHAEYDRLIGEWLANGRRLPGSGQFDLAVTEIIARFWTHAEAWYRKPDGTPTSELSTFKAALKPLNRLYGRTPAQNFGPLALEALRTAMVGQGWSRRHVNAQVARIKHLFKWAVSKELVPASVHHALTAVSGLRAGRCDARETEPVKPVPEPMVEAVLPFVSPVVAAMIKLQLITGARPGEVCILRTGDIDRSGDVWTYIPREHKTAHHGHSRTIFIGARGQEILRPFLKMDQDAFCFSPAEAEADRLDKLHAKRLAGGTPISCGNRPGTNRRSKPKRQPADVYTVASYRRAIERGCDAAFPASEPLEQRDKETAAQWKARLTDEQKKQLQAWRRAHRWHPHRLRHTRATLIRKEYGLEAAGNVLGHSSLSVTQVYAERNAEAAKRIAAAIG